MALRAAVRGISRCSRSVGSGMCRQSAWLSGAELQLLSKGRRETGSNRSISSSSRIGGAGGSGGREEVGAGADGSGGRQEAAAESSPVYVQTSSHAALLKFDQIETGKALDAAALFEGKAVLLVNTASLCGLTPQLGELELVHRRFGADGLTVLAVPSNDFGAQEPWDEDKIVAFSRKEYNVTFPLTSKQRVVGEQAHPLFRALAKEVGDDMAPVWNFHKYLLDRRGRLVAVFPSPMSPLEPDVTEAIEMALSDLP